MMKNDYYDNMKPIVVGRKRWIRIQQRRKKGKNGEKKNTVSKMISDNQLLFVVVFYNIKIGF